MPDKTQNIQENNPEHISLEERFRVSEKEGVFDKKKEQIREKAEEKSVSEQDDAYNKILSKVSDDDDDVNDDTVMQDASMLHQQTDRESQITHLIDIATTKGVTHAVKVAQKAQDYYVLDQLHDRLLANDLHDALVSRGLIEEK